jgi:hypothetical protein
MLKRVSGPLGLLLCFLPGAHAGDRDETEQPGIEFLEFLGDWETADGRWSPPAEWEMEIEADPRERDETSGERDE